MELTSLIILVIFVMYLAKNAKGKEVLNNVGDTAVHLSAAASKASAALERQCDELLSEEKVNEAKARAKAKLAETDTVADDYSDIL